MFTPETIKEHWTTLKPKVREVWPNLTELDVQAIHGDGELLVTKVREKYGIVREDIFMGVGRTGPAPLLEKRENDRGE